MLRNRKYHAAFPKTETGSPAVLSPEFRAWRDRRRRPEIMGPLSIPFAVVGSLFLPPVPCPPLPFFLREALRVAPRTAKGNYSLGRDNRGNTCSTGAKPTTTWTGDIINPDPRCNAILSHCAPRGPVMKLNSHCESRFRRRPSRFFAFRVSSGNPLASLGRKQEGKCQRKERDEEEEDKEEEEEEDEGEERRVEKNQKGKEGWNQFLGGIYERNVLSSLYRPSPSFSNVSFLPFGLSLSFSQGETTEIK